MFFHFRGFIMIKSSRLVSQQLSVEIWMASRHARGLGNAADNCFFPQIKAARLSGSEFWSLSPAVLYIERTEHTPRHLGPACLVTRFLSPKAGCGFCSEIRLQGQKVGSSGLFKVSWPKLWMWTPRAGAAACPVDKGPSGICLAQMSDGRRQCWSSSLGV